MKSPPGSMDGAPAGGEPNDETLAAPGDDETLADPPADPGLDRAADVSADDPTLVAEGAPPPAAAAASSTTAGHAAKSDSRFPPGTELAERYRIVHLLGKGGMGEVYRAEDLVLGASVALKFLPAGLEQDPELLERLVHEVHIARQTTHPNVCRVYDLGELDGAYFLSMEHIDGEDLASLLRRIGRLPWSKAIELGRQICGGVGAAHKLGILHRDLKPANVMIDGKGDAKITDFGLAGLAASFTRLDALAGTPAYMSPEQLAGREVTFRSDIYALGLVLYEMFTGQRVFVAKTLQELITLHGEAKPPAPSSRRPSFDAGVEAMILRCLEKDPDLRPETADEVAAALEGTEPETGGAQLKTLLSSELVGAKTLVERLGDTAGSELLESHDKMVRELLEESGGREIDSGDGLLTLFGRPWEAVRCALRYHRALGEFAQSAGVELKARVGVHLGEVVLRRNSPEAVAKGARPLEVEGQALSATARLRSLAGEGQTLLSQTVFDLARRGAVGEAEDLGRLGWLAHGNYAFEGVEEPVEVFEVGVEGTSPLEAPASSEAATRLTDEGTILGWRPAAGLSVPQRPNWVVEEKLGEGGFGEVWLLKHVKTGDRRVFKFCYEAERLLSLHREITVFRLLKEELGLRDDIARVLDWNLDEAPYFVEFVYTEGGDLNVWAAARGGIDKVPIEDRLEIVAQVATALAAAHSVGVLHKDVKPGNVLMAADTEGRPKTVLTDFGIGLITDTERLANQGITVMGQADLAYDDKSSMGTQLYMAPELLAGQPATTQADIYALGVMLYQVAVGDLERPLGQGWEREIEDELLREDIAAFVDGSPERRPDGANEVARRLRSLEERRAKRLAERQAREAAEKAHRRRKVLGTVAAVSSVFLVVVSFLAVQAILARGDAERRRVQAEGLIDFMLNDLHEGLEKIGRLDLLDSVARTSRDYFDSLGDRDESDEANYQRGITLLNIGDVILDQGDAEAALSTYRSALALFEQAAAANPAALEWRDGRFQSQLRLGGVLGQQENSAGAYAALETALAEAESLAASEPDNLDYRFAVARAGFDIAALQRLRGNIEAAVERCETAIALSEELVEVPGETNWRHRRLLLDASIQLANLRYVQEDRPAALMAYGRAQSLGERFAEDDPANVTWRQRLAGIYFETGFLLLSQQQLEPALEALSAAQDAYREQATMDPTRITWRVQLARTLRRMGLIRAALGAPDVAMENYRQSLDILLKLVAEDPSRLSLLRQLASVYQTIAWTQGEMGDTAGALESNLAAQEPRRKVVAAAGDDLDPMNELAWLHVLTGNTYAELGDSDNSRREWQKALETIVPVTERENLLRYRDTHVQALLKLGRLDEARPLVREMLDAGWADPGFLEAVRESGLDEPLP